MNEREDDHADALYFHHHMPVFSNALHKALISLVLSCCHFDAGVYREIFGCIDPASRSVVGSEKAHEVD